MFYYCMKNGKIQISEMMNGFEQICKSKGLRLTHQRTAIFKTLLKHTNHPTTENVFKQVRKHLKTISRDTVYRTIATFEEYGLIKKIHHVDNSTRYDINISNHHHLVCTKCNKIDDFFWHDFDKMKLPKSIYHWSQIEARHVVINGLCSSCKK